ncbi:threonine aldolase family protein [Ammoniphilus resinae]|uniref:Threonine aldolase n=1 Tax=Ammoniphilus resinae TaxID=861532 RepID=A0ABS4GLX1_9BACL|nr:low specificity L-threonine aldolase [Ammoniphilus resinae]MBP1931251.1 threonine aldolase [Ammoniphilus resinae]
MNKKSFASDNYAGIHPEVLQAIIEANTGHVGSYGKDSYTEQAIEKFKEHFGEQSEVYFVFNGTAANVLSLQALTRSYHAVLCAETAHIYTDECGAPEKFTGSKLIPIPSGNGKLNVEQLGDYLEATGEQHHSQPKVISISQTTEMGTLYTPQEVMAIAEFAHQHGLYLHMDGSRLANAAASLGCKLRDITTDVGVDVLSFGGTKNGMMIGEAVVFLRNGLSEEFKYIRKQGMQLGSKMRFISAQFLAMLKNDLWRRNAQQANEMASLLAKRMQKIPQIQITQEVQANAIFAMIPSEYIPVLQESHFFYVWSEQESVVRIMTSFDTTSENIHRFAEEMEKVCGLQ